MIEILILYIIHEHAKTIYSIRKEIIEIFGAFTKPSIGTIHPALQRLLKIKAVSLKEILSEGGKKFSYYSITPAGTAYFKKMFLSNATDNPSLFYTHLQVKLGTIGMLEPADRELFVTDCVKKIQMNKFELEEKLKNEFIEFDYYQRKLLEKTYNDIVSLEEYIKSLK